MNDAIMLAIRKDVRVKMDKSRKLQNIWSKVEQGTATYLDAHTFANELSSIMCKSMWAHSLDINGDQLSQELVKEMLTKHGTLTDLVCESAQQTLNNSAGIGLNPVPPVQDLERISGVVKAMENAPSPEEIFKEVEEPIKTCALSRVNEWVKANALAQKSAGLNPIIKRVFEGAHYDKKSKKMRVCKFCHDLAGEFDYGTEPKDIYVLHLGCRCTVEYFPNKLAKGRITALRKGETDTSQVLWNTGTGKNGNRRNIRNQAMKTILKA